jgi:hypothetical protein
MPRIEMPDLAPMDTASIDDDDYNTYVRFDKEFAASMDRWDPMIAMEVRHEIELADMLIGMCLKEAVAPAEAHSVEEVLLLDRELSLIMAGMADIGVSEPADNSNDAPAGQLVLPGARLVSTAGSKKRKVCFLLEDGCGRDLEDEDRRAFMRSAKFSGFTDNPVGFAAPKGPVFFVAAPMRMV